MIPYRGVGRGLSVPRGAALGVGVAVGVGFAQRYNEQRFPVRAAREPASFIREFPHKQFWPRAKAWDADAVSGADVASETALSG
jgi:hypothetical protein